MPQKILAPLDGSPLAASVLPHIVAYTRVNGNEVTLVRVLESDPAAPAQHDPVDWHLRKAEAQAYLDQVAGELRQYDLTVQTDVLEGPIADRVIEYAMRHEYDLIALSSHGYSGLTGWTVSSVAHKVIARSRKSILFVPAYQNAAEPGHSSATLRYKKILVPLDGSLRAESVLAKAAALARHHEAELCLTYIVTPPALFQRMPPTEEDLALTERIIERNLQEAERYFEELRRRLDPKPEIWIARGEHVLATVQRLMQDQGVDLVILAAHGHVHEDRRPYGHLAGSLLNYSAAPMVVFQDLASHEIEANPAERATNALEFSSPQRRNVPQMVAA